MLAFPAESIALLFTPKCGSNSIEEAYEPYAGVRVGGHPSLRHIDLSEYERGFSTLSGDQLGPLETVCLIRDPLDHLRSWYRYLLRPGGGDRWWTHRGGTFDHFLEYVLDVEQTRKMKTQHEFVRDESGEIGVDRIFALERMDRFENFMNERLGVRRTLPVLNRSERVSTSASSELEAKVRRWLAPDFELHAAVLRAEDGWRNPGRRFEPRRVLRKASMASSRADEYRRRAKAFRWW